ncbi:MAG: hypothetical protein ACJA2B_001133 [Candidatus Endobugula sp.]|jgi:hypothetical protein
MKIIYKWMATMRNQSPLINYYSKMALTIVLCFYCLLSSSLSHTRTSAENIPAPLQPWTNWVLDEDTLENCPYRYNASQQYCIWPSTLMLNLADNGGEFNQQWSIYSKEADVQLPGDKNNWPQNLRSNNQLLIVKDVKGVPYVRLGKGQHTLSGQFIWNSLPKSLGMTPKLGLLSLQINNNKIGYPKFNQKNTLWLSQTNDKTSNDDDLLDVQVFRKISDNHPIQIKTAIKLRVSGKQRNIELTPVLLEGFIPLQIHSRLPARMDGEKLTVQLRPGEWQITVVSRATDNMDTFTLPSSQAPWPEEEIWVFSANNTMRQVEVEGISSIDPSQTQLPSNWKSLPAYVIAAEQKLQLKTIRRGKSDKNNDKLTLKRQLWLDSNGEGYTIKDELQGSTGLSRLNIIDSIKLGSVRMHQQPQLITRLEGNQKEGVEKIGVEIRHEKIQLLAESRYDASRSTIPVSGWHSDIASIQTQLHLPAGWRLFFVSGADNLPQSWLLQWSLLDLFLVLVITFACGKLFGRAWGGIALATLFLTWHELNAPNFIWLALLITVALVRFVPQGRIKRVSQWSFILFQLVLALNLFPYVVDTLRYSLHPQLENRAIYNNTREYDQSEVVAVNSAPMSSGTQLSQSLSKRSKVFKEKQYDSYQQNLQILDPNSKIQTGPGLPVWQGKEIIYLSWSGPIKPEQTSHLLLIPPLLTAVLRTLGVILLLLLASRFIACNVKSIPPIRTSFAWLRNLYQLPAAGLVGLLVGMIVIGNIPTAEAKSPVISTSSSLLADTDIHFIPRQDILDQLKLRLERAKQNEAPECLPYCAQIENMNIAIEDNTVIARLRVHAVVDTSIPLPGSGKTWLPEQVLLNGEGSTQLQRGKNDHLWLMLPKGLHTIVLQGALSQASSLLLPLPLKPHFISTTVDAKKWTIDGINKNGQASQQLQFTRVLKNNNKTKGRQENFLPVFVKVDRYFELGLDWQVITTVSRVSNADIPINVDIDLLTNEKPLSDQVVLKNGKVRIKLNAGQKTIRWASSLPVSSSIHLQASQQVDYLETWRLNANAIWHWQAEGFPINLKQAVPSQNIGQQGIQQTIAVWYPWPNEKLQLNLSRPKGIDGQSITVQDSTLATSIGKRAKEVNLSFTALSSRGTQHDIILPAVADVQTIKIDGVEQSIQQVNNHLTLTLKPGKQQVAVLWREDTVLDTIYRTPDVDLQLNSVNANSSIQLPKDRWLLWTFGPTTGPAVLFWGVIIALLLLSFVLGQSKLTPLKTWHWGLLALGLSQTHALLILLLIAWLAAISLRSKLNADVISDKNFNLYQVGFVALTVLALLILTGSVAYGLLGSPSMSVAGNDSNAYLLRWYQDRVTSTLPEAGMISLPLWVYRMLMLAWALWLATSVLRWLQSAWVAFNNGGLWRHKAVEIKKEISK